MKLPSCFMCHSFNSEEIGSLLSDLILKSVCLDVNAHLVNGNVNVSYSCDICNREIAFQRNDPYVGG